MRNSFRHHRNILDKILTAVGWPSTLNAIHRYRKGKCTIRRVRTFIDIDKGLSDAAIKAVASFVLRAATFKTTDFDTSNRYPPIAIAVSVPESFTSMFITIKSSRAMRLLFNYILGQNRPRVLTAQAGTSVLVSHFAVQMSIVCNIWRTMSVCAMLHFPDEDEVYSNQQQLKSAFEAAVHLGVRSAGNHNRHNLVNYGGVYREEDRITGE